MSKSREFDIIIYGASGFTGRLVAEYLNKQYPGNDSVKWAMAGRNAEKLASVRDEMGLPADTPLVTADSDDPSSLSDMANRTRACLLYTSPSPRDRQKSRMPSSA